MSSSLLNQLERSVSKVRSNPSLKRSANGRPPGPVWRYAVRGTFSPARAWRPAVVARLARTLGLRNMQFALAKFADACVVSSIRERFIHEALKRPSKLHERICHHTAELLEPRFCGGSTTFNPEEQCLILRDATGFKEIAWREIQRSVAVHFHQSGPGVLPLAPA